MEDIKNRLQEETIEALQNMKEELADEAQRILQYWERVSWDPQDKIFHTLGCDNQPLADGYRSAVLIARILWAYAAVCRMGKNPHALEMAELARQDLMTHFTDSTFGGIYAGLQKDGTPDIYDKDTYTQSYAIYGLTELYRANGDRTCLDQAMEIFRLIEAHAYDKETGTYAVRCDRTWKDLGGDQQVDTYLHLTEAYTNLYEAGRDDDVKEALRKVASLLAGRFVRSDGALYQSLTRQWTDTADLSDRFGDDAEGSWMLTDAAKVLEEPAYYEAAGRLAENILTNGYDYENGGVFDRKYADGSMSTDKMWWEESENVIAMLYACRQTYRREYAEKALETWQFIRRYMCVGDGTWNWMVEAGGKAVQAENPADPLMCPYHSIRVVTHSISMIGQFAYV